MGVKPGDLGWWAYSLVATLTVLCRFILLIVHKDNFVGEDWLSPKDFRSPYMSFVF